MSAPRTQSIGSGIRVDHRSTCRAQHPNCKCPMSWWVPKAGGGRTRRTGFVGTRREAVTEKQRGKLAALDARPEDTPAARTPTLFEFCHVRLVDPFAGRSQHATDRYETAYRLRIHPELGRLQLDEITVDMVEGWCDRLVRREGNGRAVEYAFVTLRWLLNEAVRRQHITFNPCASIQYRKRYGEPMTKGGRDQLALSASEYERVKAAAAAEGQEALLRVRLATEGTMRRAELAGLRWRDFDADGCTLRIDEAVTHTKSTGLVVGQTKTHASTRTLGIGPDLRDLLVAFRATQEAQPDHFVFAGRHERHRHRRDATKPITPHALTRWFSRLLVRTSIVTTDGKALVTFHALRRTGATLAIARGVPVAFVQKQLGHTTSAMTERSYVMLDDAGEHHAFAIAFASELR